MRSFAALVACSLTLPTLVVAQGKVVPALRQPVAAYALFGFSPGVAGIVVAEEGPVTEMFLNGFEFSAPFWHVLRHDPDERAYVDRLVSPVTNCEGCFVRRLLRANFLPGDPREVALVDVDHFQSGGRVEVFDEKSGATLLVFDTDGEPSDGAASDLDGDGLSEFVLLTATGLHVLAGDGTPEWGLLVTGSSVTIGQLDGDPALEIATSTGTVVDTQTRAVQWAAGSFGAFVTTGQLDADRPEELVTARQFGVIQAFDVDQQKEKWSFDNFNTSALQLSDLDADGVDEVLVGDAQFGGITIRDGVSLAQEGFIPNAGHRILDIQVADVDRDGALEIAWSSTQGEHFLVSDATTLAEEWRAPSLSGPMVGPGYGDVNGDGMAEVVAAGTRGTIDFGGGAHIVFLDQHTLAQRVLSPPLVSESLRFHDLVLSDIDGDDDEEIVLAGDDPFTGFVRIYDVGAGFELDEIMVAFANFGTTFRVVELADADGNGVPEVLAGSGGESSGSTGNRVYAFDPATGTQLRRSASLGSTFDFLEALAVGDIDHDGVQEVAALLHGGEVGVFDGRTLATEAILPGTFTALALVEKGLLLGEPDGHLRFEIYDGTSFQTLFSRDLGERPVTAITPRPRGRLLIAHDGPLTLHGPGLVKQLWRTESYGPSTGRRVLSIPTSQRLVTCGAYGVFAFTEP